MGVPCAVFGLSFLNTNEPRHAVESDSGMKRLVFPIVLCFVLILILCSCSDDVYKPEKTELIVKPDTTVFLCNGQDVLLSISAAPGIESFDSIQWYETDKNGNSPIVIEGANSLEYEVPAFDAGQIRYFFCKVSKGNNTDTSKVFSVARTGLPVVSITTYGEEITKEEWIDDVVDFNGDIVTGKIKGRGNSSWHFNKKSFSLKLDDKAPLFGMPEHKRWVLIGNGIDDSLLRNYFASYLGTEVFTGHGWNPSFVFVDLVMDGTYWGNYLLGEQIKISKKRVNIKDIKDAGVGNGGFILEVNVWKDEDFNFVTKQGVAISLKDPDEVSQEIQQHVQNIIQEAEDVLFSDDFKNPDTGYAKYFDVASVIDWYLVNEITSNFDASFRTSVYMYYDNTDGKIHMGPNWDFDRSCGIGIRNVKSLHIQKSKWMKRFFEDSAFVEAVKTRYTEVRDELEYAANGMLTEMAGNISVSAELNNARWKIRDDYESSVETLQTWLNERLAWLDDLWLDR